VAFIDYHYYGQYIDFFKEKGIPVIYGTHNVQSKVVYQLPAVSIKNSISITLEFLVDQLHERYYLRKADAVIAVSDNDRNYYTRYISSHKIFVIPNFVLDEEYSSRYNAKQDYIIMTGNFLAYQNIMGLLWFIEKIWNDKVFETQQLILAGLGSDKALDRINETFTFSNIKALGSVKDLKPLIAEAKLSVVPILHGSGTRLKCIESMALKTQILSTTKGAEGIDHEGSIIIADTPEFFKKQLISILHNNTDYTARAFEIYKNKYSLEPNRQVFNKILNQILQKK
jgi:polysaccharide biosynthesis protein PslH